MTRWKAPPAAQGLPRNVDGTAERGELDGLLQQPSADDAGRRRNRPRGGVPATRDLTTTLRVVLAIAAALLVVAAFVPLDAIAYASVLAGVQFGAAAAVLFLAVLALSPPILRSVTRPRRRPVRAAIVGSVASARDLRAELRHAGVEAIELVGAILPTHRRSERRQRLELGTLAGLGPLVEAHEIDLVVIGPGVSRPEVVSAVMSACEGNPVRLCDLSTFYEDVFGRVPIAELNSAWFQYVLHPRFRERRSQRVFDLLVAGALGFLLVPLLAAVALLIRTDGGPVLYRQRRTGQHGRPFVMYKLRTMRWEGEGGVSRWTADGDPRVTLVGRILRRTHLDELPQIYNVLRGDMTLVGPRPEQPEIAARLETAMPFWRARYRHKPGIAGWAQIHCGYAGSDDGSAWKLAYDLYYLRHRSLVLDTAILLQTASILLLKPQYLEHPQTPFVVQRVWPAALGEPSLETSAAGPEVATAGASINR